MVHLDSHRVSRALWYSGTPLAAFDFAYGTVTPFGRLFQVGSAIYTDRLWKPYNPKRQVFWFGLYPVRSPLLGVSQLISLPLGTEMFHFPRFALYTYVFSAQ